MLPAIIALAVIVIIGLVAFLAKLLNEMGRQRQQIEQLLDQNVALQKNPEKLSSEASSAASSQSSFGQQAAPLLEEQPTLVAPAARKGAMDSGGFGSGIGGISPKAAMADTFHSLEAVQESAQSSAAQELHEQLIDFAKQQGAADSRPPSSPFRPAASTPAPAPKPPALDLDMGKGKPTVEGANFDALPSLDELFGEETAAVPPEKASPAPEPSSPTPEAPAARALDATIDIPRPAAAPEPPAEEEPPPVPDVLAGGAPELLEKPAEGPDGAADGRSTLLIAPSEGSGGGGEPRSASSLHFTPLLTTLFGETRPSRIVIETEEVVLGRSADVDYSLEDGAASRQHAKLVYSNFGLIDQRPRFTVVDLNSSNGVYVNGQKVNGSMPLPDNARIAIGQTQLGFYVLSFPKRGFGGPGEGSSRSGDSGGSSQDKSSASTSTSRGGSTSKGPNATHKVCIVDSDFAFASDLRSMLEKTGRYSVVVYRSLDKALEGFSKNPPSMLLLDADMPGSDMRAMCREVKDTPLWAGVPIILLFNVLDHDRMRGARKAGAQSYLTKPITNLSLLTSRIDIHMNINRMISSMGAGGK